MIVSSILHNARTIADSPALIYGDKVITYFQLASKMNSAAALLQREGVLPGDRVVLTASNTDPAFIYGYFATQLVGAIPVPVYAKISTPQLERICELTEPRCSFLGEPGKLRAGHSLPFLDGDVGEPTNVSRDMKDTAQIIFTTGTTGLPKGVELSHRNLAAFARIKESAVTRAPEARELIPLPLNHVFGLGRILTALASGATAIIVDGFQSPGRIFQALDQHKATSLCCVPSGFAMIFELTGDLLGDYRHQLRYIETASAPLAPAHRKRLMELLPDTRLYMAYGLTEAAGSIVFTEFHGAQKAGSIGRPGSEVQTAVNESGQLMFAGPMIMKGYWRNPAETARVLIDGWLLTNDLGSQDEEGFLFLSGRKEEIINIGGLKVAPAEIENAIQEHPSVKECACVGREQHEGWSGETVMAYLVSSPAMAKPSNDELVRFLRNKLEPHKIPTEFQWIDQLPKTPTGKLRRGLLKQGVLS